MNALAASGSFAPTVTPAENTVARCTDYLFHDDGMVGYSLMAVDAVALPLSAVVLWYGRRHFIRTLDAAARWSEAKAA